jgi:hypothetical protein
VVSDDKQYFCSRVVALSNVMTERSLFHVHVPSLDGWPDGLDLASPHHMVFLAVDGREVTDDLVARFASEALDHGAAYFSIWGPGCEHLHDLVDRAAWQRVEQEDEKTVILTAWHSNESLAEALWFAVNSASPAAAYRDTCEALLAITVGPEAWGEEASRLLRSPRLLDEAVFSDSDD